MKPANEVVVGGRTFRFVPMSIGTVIKLQKHKFDDRFIAVDFAKLGDDQKAYDEFWETWKEFCNTVLVKDWRWKMGLFPKQLTFNVISAAGVIEVTRAFFVYAGALPPEQQTQKENSHSSE